MLSALNGWNWTTTSSGLFRMSLLNRFSTRSSTSIFMVRKSPKIWNACRFHSLYHSLLLGQSWGRSLYETCNGSFFFNCFQFIWLRYWTVNKKSVGGEIRSKKLRGLNITTPTWDPLFLLLKTHFVTDQAKLSFIQKTKNMSMCSGNPLVCDCEMKWYKKWWEGYWQKIDTDYIKVRFKQKQKLQKYFI